ncbi:UvrD-helicase domain-containing protein [Microbacterium sp. lyk4-40-TSB-66]|uniref:UvrD-helicase domain-containing protein n=1 Tax=Microbacterium sp. lyk4-40-TSB-66 TaxID=3040294 RepID=UPI00255005EB|nr:UvrD-helicase domain-containing protein [Microbacterium sp. lyk4-40-TSB-66]
MKSLVTTVRALRELAGGTAIDAVAESTTLSLYAGSDFDVLVARGDGIETQRITFRDDVGPSFEDLVPIGLRNRRREVLSRLAAFAERAQIMPFSLPRPWGQYRRDNFVAFFAVAGGDHRASRWIAELVQGDTNDVLIWRWTNSQNKEELAEFVDSVAAKRDSSDDDWLAAINQAEIDFAESRSLKPGDVDLFLPRLKTVGHDDQSFAGWLGAASDEQRLFIESTVDRSVRLMGPAGSGKTLALTLKAVREVLAGRERNDSPRILFVTHSWSLAAQISDNVEALGLGAVDEIEILPLLEVAQKILPSQNASKLSLTVLGDDSLSGKQAQLTQILEVMDEFRESELITYARGLSASLLLRLQSETDDMRAGLAWDLLIEFGSVIGAAGIFPGAGSLARYRGTPRSPWMLDLGTERDFEVVFRLYERYMSSLDERGLMTSDQVLGDFLGYLISHQWNKLRRTEAYDFVFVDELHLFSPLESRVLHFLTSDPSVYPRILMAMDPRQSASEMIIGPTADATRTDGPTQLDVDLGDIEDFRLTSVHRFTPQILELVKHIHHEFPTFGLGKDWSVDLSSVESTKESGPLPRLTRSGSREGEAGDIVRAVHDLYAKGRMAMAVVDPRQWARYSAIASEVGKASKFSVTSVTGRSDIDGVGYRRHGLVVAPAEFLAGLQFDSVLVVGIPDVKDGAAATHESVRLLSLLYLAVSRAEREVRFFVNRDDGPESAVLSKAVDYGLLDAHVGSEV